MRIAYDTNLLIYADAGASSPQDVGKWRIVTQLTRVLADEDADFFVPAQVLVETHDVLIRKLALSREQAEVRIEQWAQNFDVIPTDAAVIDAALTLSSRHQLRIFDAVILAAAAEAECAILYSEDLHAGLKWRGCEVVNPFA